MKYNLKLTNTQVDEQLKNYLEDKLGQIEKVINPQDESVRADVELAQTTKHHRTGPIYRAEIKLHLAGGYLYAAEQAEDLAAALDLVKDEIIRQINTKEKRKVTLLRRGGRLIKSMLRGINPWNWRGRS
jgi:ribosomal subunit interface protein